MHTEAAPPVPEKKPFKMSVDAPIPFKKPNREFEKRILDFIAKLESSDNYNIIVGGEEKSLTKMTIKEIRKLQKSRNDQNLGTAMGRYQIIDDKMVDLIRWMGLDENELFDEYMQDKMGRKLLRHRGLERYRVGQLSQKDFIKNLADEWAAIPVDLSNKSSHAGIGNNRALTDYETIKKLLEE